MLDKFYAVFADMQKVQHFLVLVGYPEALVERLPRLIPNFLLLVMVLFLVKYLLVVLKVVPSSSKRYERWMEAGAPFTSGWLGGMLVDVCLFFGLMTTSSFMKNITKGFRALGDGSIFANVILFVLLLVEIAFMCAFYVPLVLSFINNIRVWGVWGFFETILKAFMGLSVFIFIAAAFLISFISILPYLFIFALYMFGLYGICQAICSIMGI